MVKSAEYTTVTTKAGEYPVERIPGDWKNTQGALEDSRREINIALKILEKDSNA